LGGAQLHVVLDADPVRTAVGQNHGEDRSVREFQRHVERAIARSIDVLSVDCHEAIEKQEVVDPVTTIRD